MRKPLLFAFILIALWVWSVDVADILYYYLRYPYSHFIGYFTGAAIFAPLAYGFTRLYLKHLDGVPLCFKPQKDKAKEYGLLLLFFLPVLFLNYQRIIYPDVDFDVHSYHLGLQNLNRLDNLKNFNLVGGDGGGSYFFALPYKISALFRSVLGYRMATILNTWLLLMVYLSVYDLLKRLLSNWFPDKKIHAAWITSASLFVIFSDNTLFNLNAYKIDVMGVPLLLELIHIVLFKPLTEKNRAAVTIFFFLLSSLIIAFKLTFLPYMAIIAVFFIAVNYRIFLRYWFLIFCGLLVFIFPSLYLAYNYTETLNPIFPFYNKTFHSPLYPDRNFRDMRWGPRSIGEMFYYNVLPFTHKERYSEAQFFSLRIWTEYFIIGVSIVLLIIHRFKLQGHHKLRTLLLISAIAILCNYALLYTTGYYRYGVLVEVLFGVIAILWAFCLYFLNKRIVLGALVCLMLVQFIDTYKFIFRHQANLSWYNFREMRQTKSIAAIEPHMLFNDYDTGVDSAVKTLNIKAFFNSYYNGYSQLIAPEVPIYNISAYGQRKNVIIDFEQNVMDTLTRKHNVYALSIKSELMHTIADLNAMNYYVDSIVDLYPKFLLTNNPLYLLRIKRYEPGKYAITNKMVSLREQNLTSYRYTDSNTFRAFVIDDPFLYNDNERPTQSRLYLNDSLYQLPAANRQHTIITLPETRQLDLENAEPKLSYFVIIQQFEASAVPERLN